MVRDENKKDANVKKLCEFSRVLLNREKMLTFLFINLRKKLVFHAFLCVYLGKSRRSINEQILNSSPFIDFNCTLLTCTGMLIFIKNCQKVAETITWYRLLSIIVQGEYYRPWSIKLFRDKLSAKVTGTVHICMILFIFLCCLY